MYQGMELSKLVSDVAINAFALHGVKKAISAMPAGGGWMMMLGYCGIIAYLRTGIYDTNKEQEQC